jgi:hypothetical protein
MSNYIKIQVGVPADGDLPLKVQDGLTPIDITTVQFVTAGTSTDLTFTSNGDGTGAAGEVVIGGTDQASMTVALNITSGGQNYKVGDTVSITSDGGANFTGSVDFVIDADMLITPPADGVELIDANQVVCVETPASSDTVVKLFTNEYNGSAVSTYTCTFELDNTTIEELAVNISEAFRKAEQAENSQPFVELGDADCLSVVFA